MKKFLGLLFGVLLTAALFWPVQANAANMNASSGINLGTFATNYSENIKILGRTKAVGNDLRGEFSGSGFDMNITTTGGTLTVGINTNYSSKFSILVDGTVVSSKVLTSSGSISANISAGNHTIRFIKQSSLSTSKTAYCYFTTLTFPGTIGTAPADKELLIEIMGDSYTAGCGSAAKYNPGVSWTKPQDDAVTEAYSYKLGEMLDCDVRILGLGGVGLDGGGSQQETLKITAQTVYEFDSYEEYEDGKRHDFTKDRVPDVVIVELGPNDSNTAANVTKWAELCEEFILQIKSHYGKEVPVLWIEPSEHVYQKASLYEALKDWDFDTNGPAYGRMTYLLGNGSSALNTQYNGHPDGEDEEDLAKRVYNYLTVEGILEKEEPAPSGTELVYYVSAGGNDSNDGLTLSTAKKTIPAVTDLFRSNPAANGTTVHIYVQGEVELGQSGNQRIGLVPKSDIQFKRADGSLLPFIIETYDYNGSNRAVLDVNWAPTLATGGNALVGITFPCTFKNVKIYGTQADTQQGVTGVTRFFTGFVDVVMDNVTFGNVLNQNWTLSACDVAYRSYEADYVAGTKAGYSSLTLLNGRYDETTGVGSINAVGVTNLYLASGSKTSAATSTVKLTIGKGAKAANVTGVTAFGLTLKEVIVEVQAGGEIPNGYIGTASGTAASQKVMKHDLTFILNGGKVYGPDGKNFACLGQYVTVNGNSNFISYGGSIDVGPGANRYLGGMFLGAGPNHATVNGNVTNTITGGSFILRPASETSQSNIYLGGGDTTTITGKLINDVENATFMVLPTVEKQVQSVVLGLWSGSVQTEVINRIKSGFFCVAISNGHIQFGSQGVYTAIRKITNVIGEDSATRNKGPKFMGHLYLAGNWGQYGVTSYQTSLPTEVSSEVVISTTIKGGRNSAETNLTPPNNTGSNVTFVNGSAEIVIENYLSQGALYGAGQAPIYGHVNLTVNGGIYHDILGTKESANVHIYDGLNVYIGEKVKSFDLLLTNAGTADANKGKCYGAGLGTIDIEDDTKTALKVQIKTDDFTHLYGNLGATVNGKTSLSLPDSASDIPHVHCVCGGTCEGIGDHVCSDITWTAWKSDSSLPTTTGAYYLCKDVYLTNHWIAAANQDVKICLNGHKVYGPTVSNKRTFCLTCVNPTLSICDCDGGGNGEIIARSNDSAVLGGNVFAGASTNAVFNLYGGKISGGVCKNGGSLYLSGTNTIFRMYGGTLNGGQSKENGGNVHIASGSTFYMYGGLIDGGKAGTTISGGENPYGGNISNAGTCYIYGGAIRNGECKYQGGNILSANGSTIVIKNAVISGGKSNGRGGGNFCSTGATATISDCIFENGRSTVGGGDMWLTAGTMTLSGKNNFSGGQALYAGSILNAGATLTIQDGTYHSGTVTQNGGLLEVTSGTVNIKGGTFKGWTKESGKGVSRGDVLCIAGGTVNISGGTFENGYAKGGLWQNNTETSAAGGTLYMNSGTLKITGGVFKNGEAGSWGGCLALDGSGATVTIANATISGGKAQNGGNIYYNGAVKGATITDSLITAGHCTNRGANVAVYDSTNTINVRLLNSQLTDGISDSYGANVCAIAGTITAETGTVISGGSTAVAHGGNVNTCGGTFILAGATIRDGKATTGGGNVSVTGGEFRLNSGLIENGLTTASTSRGNNINCWNGAKLTINGGTILDNSTNSKSSVSVSATDTACSNFSMTDGKIFSGENCVLQLTGATGVYSISGGEIEGTLILDSVNSFIEGGYFTSELPNNWLKEGLRCCLTSFTDGTHTFPYHVEEGILVLTYAKSSNGAQTGFAPVIGGGYYGIGFCPTLSAQMVSGYEFDGWYQGESFETATLVSNDLQYTADALTKDVNYYAVYTINERAVVISISAPAFSYSVDNGHTWKAGEDYVQLQVTAGAPITVSFTKNESLFYGWMNSSNRLLSRNADGYTFVPAATTNLIAEYTAGTTKQVIFTNLSNQLISIIATNEITAAQFPASPLKVGSTFVSWDKTVAQINEELLTKDSVTVKPVYSDNQEERTVRLQKATIDSSNPEDFFTAMVTTKGTEEILHGYLSNVNLVRTDASLESGEKFIGAVIADTSREKVQVISRNPEFAIHLAGDVQVYLLYSSKVAEPVSEATVQITYTEKSEPVSGKYCLTVSASRSIPEGYEVLEQGFFFTDSNKTDLPEPDLLAQFTPESLYGIRYVSTSRDLIGTTVLDIKNITDPSTTYFIRAYVIIRKGDAIEKIYSDAYSGNYETGLLRVEEN